MCFEANLALGTHALYYIHACALLARLRFASQDGKNNNDEAKIITRFPQEARVTRGFAMKGATPPNVTPRDLQVFG